MDTATGNRFTLVDDALDTVVQCNRCGQQKRFNLDVITSTQRVTTALRWAEEEHECGDIEGELSITIGDGNVALCVQAAPGTRCTALVACWNVPEQAAVHLDFLRPLDGSDDSVDICKKCINWFIQKKLLDGDSLDNMLDIVDPMSEKGLSVKKIKELFNAP